MNLSNYEKVESVTTYSDCKTTSKKRTESSCVFKCSSKVQKGEER